MSLKDLWENNKISNIQATEVSKEEEKEGWSWKPAEEIMVENFTNLAEDINLDYTI